VKETSKKAKNKKRASAHDYLPVMAMQGSAGDNASWALYMKIIG
jgi:hypothetical protein